jgi:hypothetical protein
MTEHEKAVTAAAREHCRSFDDDWRSGRGWHLHRAREILAASGYPARLADATARAEQAERERDKAAKRARERERVLREALEAVQRDASMGLADPFWALSEAPMQAVRAALDSTKEPRP